jgi:uncharacterized membrane protein YcaP (DUF421 family)
MLDMQFPWWEFVVRAAIVYAVLLALVRMTGKRSVGQFTPFDLIVVMLLSEAVSGSLHGQDESLPGGLIAAATLMALNVLLGFLSARSHRIHSMVEGEPVIIGRDGRLFEDVLRRERVPRSDVEKALRSDDVELEEMRMAVLEADGSITILKRDKPLVDGDGKPAAG